MNSEKVKEIKKALECWQESVMLSTDENYISHRVSNREILDYINELESENEKLKQHKRELQGGQQDLTKRIAELEEYIKGNTQDAKAFVNGWHKDLKQELKQFAEMLIEKYVNNSNYCAKIYEPFGGITPKDIDETLKEFIEC